MKYILKIKKYWCLIPLLSLLSCSEDNKISVSKNTVAIGELDYVKTYGGSKNDVAQSVVKTLDGGYAVVGHSQSNNGDIVDKPDEGFDFWVLKFAADNPLTKEGVDLGKKLFFDMTLSGDGTQSCATCHDPKKSFTDHTRFSDGIDGNAGNRNSMPLYNLAWNFEERFAWDGKELSLERQALEPVSNPIEMHANWTKVAERLKNHSDYLLLFKNAFGTSNIDSTLVTKAIAQFERTVISGNSKFDKHLLGKATLTIQEQNGFNVFMDESRGDCFHCHGSDNNPLWTDNKFHNNGLDLIFTDLGLGKVTGDPADNGKFKSPSLRNLAFTAPYINLTIK